jgi:hypothetical protein
MCIYEIQYACGAIVNLSIIGVAPTIASLVHPPPRWFVSRRCEEMVMLGAREDERCPHYTQLVDTALFMRGYRAGFGDGRRDFVMHSDEEYREWESDEEQEDKESGSGQYGAGEEYCSATWTEQ